MVDRREKQPWPPPKLTLSKRENTAVGGWWWTNQGEPPPQWLLCQPEGKPLAAIWHPTMPLLIWYLIGEAPVTLAGIWGVAVWSANPLDCARSLSAVRIITDCFCFFSSSHARALQALRIVDFYVGYQNYVFNTRIQDPSMLASCGLSIITVSLAIPLIVGSCCLHHTVGPNVSLPS